MASVPFVIERRLQYHGIWNAGYNIGELFFKSVSKDFVTKPAYPAVLKLSIGSLTLTVFQRSSSHPKEIRTDTIPFGALRDITVNAFNTRCLMVIYINNKNKYSVLVMSCRDAKETRDIEMAFKRLSSIAQARKIQAEQGNANWTIRKSISSHSPTTTPTTTNNNKKISTEIQNTSESIADERDGRKTNDKTNVINGENMTTVAVASLGPETNGHSSVVDDADASSKKRRTTSSVLAENFDFLREHEEFLDEDAVFDDVEMFEKEDGPGENSFSVGLQVNVHDRSDQISISSETSFLSFQSIRDEVDSMTPSSAITEEEYSKRMFEVPVNASAPNGNDTDSGHAGSSLINGSKETEINCHVITVDKTDDYDYRGVGIQTEGLGKTRYTKKSGSVGSPNIYKAMAAQRKLKQNAEDNPRPQQTVPVPLQNVSRARPTSQYITNDVRGEAVSSQPQRLSRTVRIPGNSKSTISRPIEEVYQRSHTWSRRGTGESRRRHLVIVHSGRNTVRL